MIVHRRYYSFYIYNKTFYNSIPYLHRGKERLQSGVPELLRVPKMFWIQKSSFKKSFFFEQLYNNLMFCLFIKYVAHIETPLMT